jgi:UDP-N-acetylmuramoyl-tripeptide--D-alanyl-D-alanine ligase
VGAYAAQEGVQKLFALGEQTKHSVMAFKNSSTQNTSAEHYPEVDALCAALRESLSQRAAHEKTTVLVKGSRFMKMERVVKALTEETH